MCAEPLRQQDCPASHLARVRQPTNTLPPVYARVRKDVLQMCNKEIRIKGLCPTVPFRSLCTDAVQGWGSRLERGSSALSKGRYVYGQVTPLRHVCVQFKWTRGRGVSKDCTVPGVC